MSHLRRIDIERLNANELPPATRLEFEDHLSTCAKCRDYRDQLDSFKEALHERIPPEEFAARVAKRLSERASAPANVTKENIVTRLFTSSRSQSAPRRRLGLVLAAAAALIVVGLVGLLSHRQEVTTASEEQAVAEMAPQGTRATVAQIIRAAADGQTGVEVRISGSDQFEPVTVDATIASGATVRTDARTRVRLDLSDGTVLVLNHETELTFNEGQARQFNVTAGEILADVAHLDEGPAARFHTPTGQVEVLGTKLVITATDDVASVRVTRGLVRIHDKDGAHAEVKAGEEGLITSSGELSVSPAVNLSGSIAWAELEGSEEGIELPVAGLGQLRARRPGEREDQERPLSLASHKVRVRIVGNMAHTEVEEVFRNDSPVTLEGIYRFPMPPDARIARLALDVDGELEEGAFVERDVASKIWQGVIRRAEQRARPRQTPMPQEFIWVRGPWRDPALLEWQRGGQFQLRIFPIPARGERRVIIGYTQTIQPQGETRRYVYPLAHSTDASTKVGRFELDLRVSGADSTTPVKARGYSMETVDEGNATQLHMVRDSFVPAGDVVVDYALPNSGAEIQWWTFQGNAAAAPTNPTSTRHGRNPTNRSAPEVIAEQRALAQDSRPYVAFAIRPELPTRIEAQRQDLVLVVDSSQSMVGERFTRAGSLVTQMIAEMDRRDRFLLMACDATCQTMPSGLQTPSSRTAEAARTWLSTIRPAGSSDIVTTLENASRSASHADGRKPRIIYIGDGIATVGHRRAGAIAAQVEALSRSEDVTFTTVGIGGDSDTMALSAIARSGGGHFVPYVPGQRASAAALAVLETTFGVSLRDATIELPTGLTDFAPARLPTIRAGEELIVVGRFDQDVSGDVIVRGMVAGEPYEDRYPVQLSASTAAGNAFVPRLWAAATIEQIEIGGQGADRARAIALSRAYGVMSRDTSLLVLESEAMFRAFGVDRVSYDVQWAGEEDIEVGQSTGTATHARGTVMNGVLGRIQEQGDGQALGNDPENALGALMGTDIDNDLGTRGTGRGGGGNEEGEIGLGNLNTIGHGGGGGSGAGYGRGAGGLRGRRASVPTIRAGRATVKGSLDREIIRRYVRRHINQIRFCYERELQSQPNLAGRVNIRFVISPSGAVSSSNVASSTIGNAQVEQCVARAVQRIPFPHSNTGGVVVVTYPFMFQNDGGSTAPALVRRPAPPERFATIQASASPRSGEQQAVERAEEALRQSPDSRDRHRDLVRALARAGDLDRAIEVAEQWITRDQLDPEALTALADLLGRSGRRDESIRLLSGVVELQPDSRTLHERLANAFKRNGDQARSCSHRVTLAEIEDDDVDALSSAVRCTRDLGSQGSADQVLDGIDSADLRARVERAAATPVTDRRVSGQLMLSADWDQGGDLDLSLITPQGTRLSWMGGRRTVVGTDASNEGREQLGLRGVWGGSYIIEVSRTESADDGPINGRIRVAALGTTRTIPFTLQGDRAAVGRVTVQRRVGRF